MAFTLRITQLVKDELDQRIQFIEQQWPASVKTDLLASMAHKMQLIETMPPMCRASISEPSIREYTINQYVPMCYRVSEASATIDVLSFRDNRRRQQ